MLPGPEVLFEKSVGLTVNAHSLISILPITENNFFPFLLVPLSRTPTTVFFAKFSDPLRTKFLHGLIEER